MRLLLLLIFIVNMIIAGGASSSTKLQVYLPLDISSSDISEVETSIKSMDHVVAVRIIPKQEALENFKAGLGEAGRKALEGYEDENNPLPDSFEVEVDSPKHRNQVKAAIEKLNETMDSQPIMNVH